MMGKMMANFPKTAMPCVDVRDVAKAHLEGVLRPEAANQRFILCERTAWMNEIHTFLEKDYGNTGYKMAKGTTGKGVLSFLGMFNQEMKLMAKMVGVKFSFKNDETKQVLGIDFIPLEKGVPDMAASLIDIGYVPDKRNTKKSCC